MGNPKLPPAEVIAMRRSGMAVPAIAAHFGHSTMPVRNILKAAGVGNPSISRRRAALKAAQRVLEAEMADHCPETSYELLKSILAAPERHQGTSLSLFEAW